MEIADKLAIAAELIHAWGVYRDQGKWKELRATFTSEGHISVSWFRGPFEQFVHCCRAGFGASRAWSRHHLLTLMITLDKDRAIAETPFIIRVRQRFGSVEVDLTSSSRFLDRVERHADSWLIAERAAIYERDRPDPVEPSPEFDALFEAAGNTVTWPSASHMRKAARSRPSSIATAGQKRRTFMRATQSGWPAGRLEPAGDF